MLKLLSCLLALVAMASAEAIAQQAEPVSYILHTRPQTPAKRIATVADSLTTPADPLEGLTPEQIAIVEKLNRANGARLKRLQTVVVPATWVSDELAYSPFPQEYPWAADKPQAMVVDQGAQAFAAYEYGRLVRWGPVSTGQYGQTPSGLFALSWRSRGHHSSIDPTWYMPWYFNFIPSRGIAFHQYSLPGQAASHGCVRMLERDAVWLFDWGVKGTPVVVLGCPDPSKPWQAADFLQSGIQLPVVPPASVMECRGYSGATAATPRRTIR
jgi:hypothetical protein